MRFGRDKSQAAGCARFGPASCDAVPGPAPHRWRIRSAAKTAIANNSSGANCRAAVQIAKRLGKSKVVVVVFGDIRERYLTTDLFQAERI
jgi:NADPH:quinone reductase-like Zn-dependent oxidoreductase